MKLWRLKLTRCNALPVRRGALNMSGFLLHNTEVFFGRATPAEARVYVRLASSVTQHDTALSGKLSGPLCRYAQTLPLTVPFQVAKGRVHTGAMQGEDGERSQTLLAEIVIPDPCFWTPELPFIYRVQLQLRRGTDIVETAERLVAIRRLGVRGRDLFFEGQRWVLRGVRMESTDWPDLTRWRDAAAALVVPNPSDDICEESSVVGILVVAELHGTVADIERELVRLARWPAVGLAIAECTEPLGVEIRRRAPNVLLGQRTTLGAIDKSEWPHVAICDASDLAQYSGCAQPTELPVIAERRLAQSLSPDQARTECDRLQSDLADIGDFAGYMV